MLTYKVPTVCDKTTYDTLHFRHWHKSNFGPLFIKGIGLQRLSLIAEQRGWKD